MKVSPKDKIKVLEYMRKNCLSSVNAKNKEEIIPGIQQSISYMSERYFRAIISELKQEGFVGSLSSIGYWAFPSEFSEYERCMALRSVEYMEDMAKKMLTNTGNLRRAINEKGRQMTMFNDDADGDIALLATDIHKMGA